MQLSEAWIGSADPPGARRRANRSRWTGDEPAQPEEPASIQRVARIGFWSMMKVAFTFYLVMGLAMVTAGVILASASQTVGLTPRLEHLGRTAFGSRSLPLGPKHVAVILGLVAAVIAVVGTAMTAAIALTYNFIADITGGLDVRSGHGAPRAAALRSMPGPGQHHRDAERAHTPRQSHQALFERRE